jgi:limonene-1,2-epoxide hydrolase
MFERILERSERVEWEIRTAAYLDDRAHVERVDRFWIDGACYAVPCHCVAEVDAPSGLITEFRDYLDLGMWRQSLGSVLDH